MRHVTLITAIMYEREALEQIVCLLEPLYWKCPTHPACEGCEFEQEEALRTAMNVLAGLEPGAHWGPWLRSGEPLPDDYEEQIAAKHERIESAWLKTGFERDEVNGRTVWRRGTAC